MFFSPVHDMKIKLQLTSQFNHKMNMQLWFYFYVIYWSEDDQPLVETCSHVIYMNKKQLNSCIDGKCTLSYNNIHTMEVYHKSCLFNKWANKFLTVASCVPSSFHEDHSSELQSEKNIQILSISRSWCIS